MKLHQEIVNSMFFCTLSTLKCLPSKFYYVNKCCTPLSNRYCITYRSYMAQTMRKIESLRNFDYSRCQHLMNQTIYEHFSFFAINSHVCNCLTHWEPLKSIYSNCYVFYVVRMSPNPISEMMDISLWIVCIHFGIKWFFFQSTSVLHFYMKSAQLLSDDFSVWNFIVKFIVKIFRMVTIVDKIFRSKKAKRV